MKKLVLILLVLMLAGCVWSRYPRHNRVNVEITSAENRHEKNHGDRRFEPGDHGDGRHGHDDQH